ncbi:MAG: type II secretion system F family protein, partial [Deltaproteobacteria bacterium]|nr:type II secretion system F family protein [Deltaproteobacteria bacterium]
MPLYTYKALNSAGKPEKGTLQAASEKEAHGLLRDRKMYPLDIRTAGKSRLGALAGFKLQGRASLNPKELAYFTRQLHVLLQATIPYDTALAMMQQESGNEMLRSTLEDVRARVVEGAYLADALAAHPRMFPVMLTNIVRAGEASGTLTTVLSRMAEYFENINRLRSKLTSAMIYPMFMGVFSTSVVVFMVTYIIPRITRLFDNFGAKLPLPTRILIALSNLVVNWWWLLLMIIGLGAWGTTLFLRTEKGRWAFDRTELRIPLWRSLRQKMLMQRLAQTLGTMLKSGVELKEALLVSKEVLENRVYLEAMDRVIFDVQNRGMTFAAALRRTGLFPEDLCQMV